MENKDQAIKTLESLAHFDANETAHLLRELENIEAQTYDILYSKTKFRELFPVDNSADPGAETITYRQYDTVGMASVVANYADDLPSVDAFAKEFTARVKSLGVSHQYSVQDLRRAAMAGSRLDERRGAIARESIERKFDQIAALGDSEFGIPGVLNNANIPILTLPTAGAWSTLTVDQVLENLHFMAESPFITSKEVHTADTMALPTAVWSYLARTYVDATNRDTILATFLRTDPDIKTVVPWNRLDTAGVGGATRGFVYQKSPDVLKIRIPQEYEQFPPQSRNLAFVVPGHARMGGAVVYRPLACAFADGI